MKNLNILIFWIGFALVAAGQNQRLPVDSPMPWATPFSTIKTLTHVHDAFGKGQHREFVPTQPRSEVITSRLEKGEKVWEIETKDAFYIDFYRSSSSGGERERIFTSTPLAYYRGSLILVDVFEGQDDISILAASFEEYMCFRLKRKPFPEPAVGFYILEPYAINSQNWYLDAVVQLDYLGHRFPPGAHHRAFKSVSLSGLTTIQVGLKESPNLAEVIDFSSGIPLKDGTSVQDTPQASPPNRPNAPSSEQAILEAFGIPAGDDLKWRVLQVEGGKTRVFEVLDHLSNQTVVPAMKQRIGESMGSNP